MANEDTWEDGVATRQVTASALIHRGRCLLYGWYARLATGQSWRIYDGVNAQGTQKFVTYATTALAGDVLDFTPSRPMRFERGIYAEDDTPAATETLTILYKPLPDADDKPPSEV
jgi:hypothetical protein